MKRPSEEPFPIDAVRDLLGIVRAMYAAEATCRARPERLAQIASVGLELGAAIDLAATSRPGTLGHRAAFARAEKAAHAAGDLVALTQPAVAIVQAACRRVLAG